MRNFISLSKVLIKNNMNFISDGKTKKIWKYLLMGVISLAFVPYMYLLYQMFNAYFQAYGTMDQSGTVVAIGFYLCAIMIFFFSIFIIPGIFYFSKDNQTLLSLPLSPQTIIGAKLFNSVIYEYLFSFFIMAPLFIAYHNNMNAGIWEIVIIIFIGLTIPIIPLVYSSLISMIIMRFTPLLKNRDTFNLVSTILIVVLALSFSFYFSNTMLDNPDQLMTMMMQGQDSLIPIFSSFFPFITSATESFLNKDILSLVIYILWNIAAVALLLMVGKYIYFKGALGVNESSKNSKKVNIQKASKQNSVMKTYVIKELNLLIRTPIYFMNCILSAFILTIMFFVFAFQSQTKDILSLLPIDIITASTSFAAYFILGTLIISSFLSSINMISATAISREGDHLSFMKFIPVSYANQVFAKAICGIIISILSILPIWLFAIFYLKISIFTVLISLVAMLLSVIACNLIGILVDCIHPKLVWEQEAAAVKQNMNGLLSMVTGAIFAAGIFAVLYFTPQNMLMMSTLLIVVVFALICIGLIFFIQKNAGKFFAKLS